uniref:Sine oculis-binding protein homolog n=1 Tax=Glossina brevipalpis TaxID=37001 RepID=A0A1A9WW51_9MUSC
MIHEEFAETTMNELLGWYGFDGIDRSDLSPNNVFERLGCNRKLATLLPYQQRREHYLQETEYLHILNHQKNNNNNSNSSGKSMNCHSYRATLGEDKRNFINCCWCRRPVPHNAPEYLTTSDGPRFCSESCFAQSRRASFKKAKTCDWCKHVRNAVNYVDFQDGASQLQFCSDKCLNQYKMQIFCKETQAHLDMNPHLREQGLEAASSGAGLITPDLWLRNCRSRSASPASTVSLSPVLATTRSGRSSLSPVRLPLHGKNSLSISPTTETTRKPLISVAPASKLISKSSNLSSFRTSLKHNRRKRPLRSSMMTTDIEVELKTNCSSTTNTKGSVGKVKSQLAQTCNSSLRVNPRSPVNNYHTNGSQHGPPLLAELTCGGIQDDSLNMSHLSPAIESHIPKASVPQKILPSASQEKPTPSKFSSSSLGRKLEPVTSPTSGPQLLNDFANFSHTLTNTNMSALNALIGTPHPVTIMIPYPVIIPLPIPIPIPLPVTDFYNAYKISDASEKSADKKPQQTKCEEDDKAKEGEKGLDNKLKSAEQALDFTQTRGIEKIWKPKKEENNFFFSAARDDSHHTEMPQKILNASSEKTSHCMTSNETIGTNDTAMTDDSSGILSDGNELCNDESTSHKVPKLKITRSQTKRTLMQTKEYECSRPLRKRKRIIDCDFQKVPLKDPNQHENYRY